MAKANDIVDIFDACLTLIEEGASVEECLARYPEAAGELQPLLATSAFTQTAFASDLSYASRTRISNQVMAAWDEHAARPARRWWALSLPAFAPRYAAVAASLAVLLLGGTGTVAASADALPGDTLYGVKTMTEEARAWFAWDDSDKVSFYSSLVEERVDELTSIAADGDYASASIAVDRLADHLDEIGAAAASGTNGDLASELANATEVQQRALFDIQALAQDAPEDAQGELSEAASLLQAARARVDSALDSLR